MQESKADTPYQIYDRTLKLLMRLSSRTIVLFINGLFGKQYPLDSTVDYLSSENITDSLNLWISDVVIVINHTDRYIIDAQMSNDKEMALRIFTYSYGEGLKTRIVEGNTIKIRLVPAVVIYLDPAVVPPKDLAVEVTDIDDSVHTYRFPALRLFDYSIADLEHRNMAILLPFYLLKLRKRVEAAKTAEQRQALSGELKELLDELIKTIELSEQNGQMSRSDMRRVLGLTGALYTHLYKLYPEFEEVTMMVDDALFTMVDEAELAGETKGKAEGEAKGKAERSLEIARSLIEMGLDREKIIRATKLDMGTVESLYRELGAHV